MIKKDWVAVKTPNHRSLKNRALVIQSGEVLLRGSVAGSGVRVNDSATLLGNGTIFSNLLVENGGQVAPGESIGTLTTDYAKFQAGSRLAMEIASALSFDQLVINEYLSIGPTAVLSVSFVENYIPLLADSFQLIDLGGAIQGEFIFELPDLESSLVWVTDSFHQSGTISIAAIPEPGSAVIFGILILAGLSRRSKKGFC